jgi:hypothetical protein
MTAASEQTVGLDDQRAELRAVLESTYFVRAPKLGQLLSYLCERLFAGEARQIKEYSIGLEVFHRGDAFDQNSDSIVRVEANRLRKRLAEYYCGEGASHRLHITIPIGQYVPEFEPEPARVDEVALRVAEPAVQSPAEIPAKQLERRWFQSRRARLWIAAGGCALIVVVLVVGGDRLLKFGGRAQVQPAATARNAESTSLVESQFGPPTGDEIRILAGANRSFVDHAGKLWSADVGATGGTAIKSAVQHIWRTQDPDFYRTSRQGQFRYDIPLKKGIYELRLHFAETTYGPESTGVGGEGRRLLTVRANGAALLTRFDVAADAGASRTVDVKVFTDIAPAADGKLHLEFAGEDGGQAMVSAIEILPGVNGRIRPVRVLARQSPYYSNDSRWWSPDNYYEGGQITAYPNPVSGTDDPELYQTERWGNFSYAIPVAQGKYLLRLHFAARRNSADATALPARMGSEARVFNVFCNGKALLQDFDLYREARQTDVIIRKFDGIEPNAQGKVLLTFVPIEGYATVTAIEVLPQQGN